ncbi:hypothetical protein [Pseudoalteromonas porphyrae]|uniref:Uncharacterized protein n=1 Tax=Pseudoalteromonas porphyrae TaxID=187330 RepID=A0A0N1F0T5_9GAMM|nr:hypothetical protein [Pseudoalteromonas porphyrae]KPH65636.1 hypothetical protein ADS77_01530 [Pseudoalteromonas porphyrae]
MKIATLTLSVLFITGCTSFTTVNPGGCGTSTLNTVCLGKTTVPTKHRKLFLVASNQAIDVISSHAFKNDLENFVKLHANTGRYSTAWLGIDTSTITDRLIQEIQGLQVSTFGGVKGLFYTVFYGTNAFEGDGTGPILLNRWSLPRSSASIANTIVHEVTHRIGLSHPSIKKDRKTANCEPPYLIGSLVEKHILEGNWDPKGHCQLL